MKVAQSLIELGFKIASTRGTLNALKAAGIPCEWVKKVHEGRPNIVDNLKNGEIHFVINTTEGEKAIADSYELRRAALQYRVYYTTTLSAAAATCMALKSGSHFTVKSLQELHQGEDNHGTTAYAYDAARC